MSEAVPRWRQALVTIAVSVAAFALLQLAWLPTQVTLHFPLRWVSGETADTDLLGACGFLISSAVACWLMLRFLAPRDERQPAPLARKLREAALGAAIGGGQILFDMGVLTVLGVYHVLAVGSAKPALVGLPVMLGVALIEEGMMRGVMLPRIERLLGPWWALLVTSLIFGIGHLANPNASALATLAIALEAGLALGGLYLLTRRLWAPVAMHAAWNWVCGPVMGVPLSGMTPVSWLRAELIGPELLTGGKFGPEASIIEMFAGAVIAVGVLWAWRRQIANSRPAHSMLVTPAS